MNETFLVAAGWLLFGYVPSVAVGLFLFHWTTRSRPTADRLFTWTLTPAVTWTLATVISGRSIGMLNIVEFPLLAIIPLAGYCWPLYWPTSDSRQQTRRELAVLVSCNGLALLWGIFFPSFVH